MAVLCNLSKPAKFWAYSVSLFKCVPNPRRILHRRAVMNSKQCNSNRMLALNRMTRVRDTKRGLNTQNCCAMSAFYFLLSSQTLKGKKLVLDI